MKERRWPEVFGLSHHPWPTKDKEYDFFRRIRDLAKKMAFIFRSIVHLLCLAQRRWLFQADMVSDEDLAWQRRWRSSQIYYASSLFGSRKTAFSGKFSERQGHPWHVHSTSRPWPMAPLFHGRYVAHPRPGHDVGDRIKENQREEQNTDFYSIRSLRQQRGHVSI
ncbi:hypothetical protein NL676_005508 [Syzygium grande]|nr:hypothetical protein NL676_005508 [Syzygium grande]